MEMAEFLAQSPEAARVREHIRAAVFALGMAARSCTQPGLGFATTRDCHSYLVTTLRELEAARALVPAV